MRINKNEITKEQKNKSQCISMKTTLTRPAFAGRLKTDAARCDAVVGKLKKNKACDLCYNVFTIFL